MTEDFEKKQPFSKRNIFMVPDNYFEKLQDDIQRKIRPQESIIFKIIRIPAIRLAAGTAILVTAFYLIRLPEKIDNPELILSEINVEQLERYLDENTLPEGDDILTYIDYTMESDIDLFNKKPNDSIL